MKKKMLVICPHLSTGGSGQVTANKIQLIKDDFEIKVIEHAFVAWNYVVQRNRIIALVGQENFYSLGENKVEQIKNVLDSFQPDVISMEEFPEMFLNRESSEMIYDRNREYTIIETTHDSSFNPANKVYMPDKFVFVSPFNALKYNHLDVDFEVIEYPVDHKERDKRASREKLGLEHDYKHIVIIGLFTPRKNQKYAFQLCDLLADHKVKFHFIGNMAGNFEYYWKPLLDWKKNNTNLDNCVIWGERSDTEEFIKASDLFLFPSKGDRGNKELNPIVIKEALEYDIPKLMYNLDVYLNRYHDTPDMHFLTGDLMVDRDKIIEIVQPKSMINNEELIILGTYPNLKSRVQLTKDTIKSLKPLGRKIMLLSHYPVDEDIQRMVDYYVFDAYNPLTHHSYYTRFYRNTDEYYAEVNINGLKHSNQSLTVLTNMFNGAKTAKDLGYKSFFYTTYDVILDEKDFGVVEDSFLAIKNGLGAYLGTLNTPFGKGIQTNGMTFGTDYFLNTFHDVRNADDYNKICQDLGAQNFLEDYMVKVLNKDLKDVLKIDNPQETLLIHSGLGVASNSEYYSILPIEKKPNEYMFYFYTYNVDERKVNITMKENGSEFYNNRFQLNKSREFKKEITYSGHPIEILLEFYDGDVVYKTELHEMNQSNIAKYSNTGQFKIKKKNKPKIKLVHIQTTRNDEREQKSRESLSGVAEFGIEYILHTNQPYKSLPPSHNCIRPDCVSMELFDEPTIQRLGTALTPAHYGCYEAFKNAILTEFNDEDFIIVCEGDCIIEVPLQEFADKVFQAASICEDNNIGYFSFGDTHTLEHHWLQSKVVDTIANQDLLFITNHIIGLQCIMFPKLAKKYLQEQLRIHNWDAADIYFNSIFRYSEYKMGILHHRITTQEGGFSLIDQQDKTFN
jgi:glycosyltransferase involved in cell wall biosynthesis